MPSITIELPDSVYRAALTFPHNERMRIGAIALSATFAVAKAMCRADDDADDGEPSKNRNPSRRLAKHPPTP